MKDKPEDRNGDDLEPKILCPKKKKGIGRIAECEKGDDEEEIFELTVPSIPVELGRRRSLFAVIGMLGKWNIRYSSPENPEAEQGWNESEQKDRSEVLCKDCHQNGCNERSCHGTGMIHSPLKAECLSPFLFTAGL